jgi:hypothetical protein
MFVRPAGRDKTVFFSISGYHTDPGVLVDHTISFEKKYEAVLNETREVGIEPALSDMSQQGLAHPLQQGHIQHLDGAVSGLQTPAHMTLSHVCHMSAFGMVCVRRGNPQIARLLPHVADTAHFHPHLPPDVLHWREHSPRGHPSTCIAAVNLHQLHPVHSKRTQ